MKKIFGSLNEEKNILYIVNHKVANTSIVKLLKKYGYTNRSFQSIDIAKLNYSFTFVRNPYERLISRYSHICRNMDDITSKVPWYIQRHFSKSTPVQKENFKFKDFVKFTLNVFDDHWEPQVEKFQKQGLTLDAIDYIGKFENLQNDFEAVCEKIGIPKQTLPHENKSNHNHYTEYYDDETRGIVARRYKKDFESFGYKI